MFSRIKRIELSEAKKSAIVFVFASALSSGLNILTTPIFTRIMPIDEYGVVSLFSTWQQMLNVIATFSVTNAIINVGFHDYSGDRKGFLSSALGVSTLFSFLVSIIILLNQQIFYKYSGLNLSLSILLCTGFFTLTATQLWLCLQRYEYKYKYPFIILTSTSVLSTFISLIFVINASNHYSEIKLWSTNAIPLLVGFWFYGYILYTGKKPYNKTYWKFIIGFNLPLIVHYLSQFVLSGSDRIMIKNFDSEASVAIYALGYQVSNIILIFWNPINSSLVPYMHKCVDSNDTKSLGKCFYTVIGISGLVCIAISLLAPEIVAVLGSTEYKDAMYVIPPVISGTLFMVFYSLTANIEFLYGKTNRIAVMTIVAAILNIVLNAVFIPKYGFVAAAYTTLFSYLVYSVLHYVNMVNLHKIRVVNELYLGLLLITPVVLSIFVITLYDLIMIRIILLLIIVGIVAFIYKNIGVKKKGKEKR